MSSQILEILFRDCISIKRLQKYQSITARHKEKGKLTYVIKLQYKGQLYELSGQVYNVLHYKSVEGASSNSLSNLTLGG